LIEDSNPKKIEILFHKFFGRRLRLRKRTTQKKLKHFSTRKLKAFDNEKTTRAK